MTVRRLIEEELPLEAVNAASAREKSLRHGNISTMHLWWARRPLAMSRAIVFGTLLPDPGDDARRKAILDLVGAASEFEAASDGGRMNPLRKLLADAYPEGPPKVLDCFAGGGAIPLEALRLGCDTTALELNPVAHLIEKACLEYPQRYGQPVGLGTNELAEDLVWDYTEIEPFGESSGNWDGAIRWIELAIRHCSTSSARAGTVLRGNAQSLPFEDHTFDAVVVDPPYYDAIQYGDLSDFFFVWLKRSVGVLYPELFSTPLTPKRQEVIETRADRKSPEYVSHAEFEGRLQLALVEMVRVLRPKGVLSLVFAHTNVEAWERLLRALRSAGLVVTTSWPMRSEMLNRQTASISAVLGSSVVLVCRKAESRGEGFHDDVVRELELRIAERLNRFERMGLVGADYFVSAVGPAFEVFAKYSRVVRLSGEEVDVAELMTLARQVVARRAMAKLLGDESISSLDPVSLMYLTWRWAYDGESIPADEAYKLQRALDVDLSTMLGHDGLAERVGSDFALRGPEDRKGLKIGASPLMIDVLHVACSLWDAGRRRELEQLLADTGMGLSTAFWSLARALGEVLPEGNRERTMLLGLTGNQDALASAAAKAARPGGEQQVIEWGGVEQKTLLETGPVQKRLGEE